MSKRLQVVADDELADWLDGRAERAMMPESTALRAKTELHLWRGHLAAELRSQRWSLAEIGCLAAILNGTIVSDAIGAAIILEVSEAFRFHPGEYARQHGIDEQAMLAKLGALGPTGSHALQDAIARWWKAGAEHSREAWTAVGMDLL